MRESQMSRRDALRTLGGTLVAGALTRAAKSQPADAPVIDTHVHLVRSRLPGALDTKLPLAPFDKGHAEGEKRLAKSVEEATKEAGVAQALCMPSLDISDKDPLAIEETLAISKLV